jgi:hypothetical protein
MAKGYEYRVDGGSAVDMGDNQSALISGLTASTSYDIEVRKRAADGSTSAWSSVVTQSTAGGWSPTTNLTHHWTMLDADVVGGQITDVVGGLNGSADAGITSTTGPFSNTARAFDGVSQISLASDPLPAAMAAFSVFAWVKVTNVATTTANVFAFLKSTGNYLRLIIDNGSLGVVGGIVGALQVGGVGTGKKATGDALSNNTWAHVGLTWDGSTTVKLYKDGNLIASASQNLSLIVANSIGSKGDGTQFLTGAIYGARVYDAELTSTQVTAVYNAN